MTAPATWNPSLEQIRQAKELLGADVSRDRPALIMQVAGALKAATDQGVTQERERCARIAEGSSGPFPKGALIKADGREATELAIAMQHSLGAGRDAIAAAIRFTPPPSEGERG